MRVGLLQATVATALLGCVLGGTCAGSDRPEPTEKPASALSTRGSSVLAVRRTKGAVPRYSDSPELAAVFTGAASGAASAKPRGNPDWDVTLWDGRDQRSVDVWSLADVAAWTTPGGKRVYRRVPGVAARLSAMPAVAPAGRREDAPPGSVPSACTLIPSVGSVEQLSISCENIWYGRVAGALGSYYTYPDMRRGRVAVYLVRVDGVVQMRGGPLTPYVKLQWPAADDPRDRGYYPLPAQGESFVVCSSRAERELFVGHPSHSERGAALRRLFLGEQAIESYPYGLIRVANGRTAPHDPAWTAQIESRYYEVSTPWPMSIYGQPWRPFVEYLRWRLLPENRYQQNPIPDELRDQLVVQPFRE